MSRHSFRSAIANASSCGIARAIAGRSTLRRSAKRATMGRRHRRKTAWSRRTAPLRHRSASVFRRVLGGANATLRLAFGRSVAHRRSAVQWLRTRSPPDRGRSRRPGSTRRRLRQCRHEFRRDQRGRYAADRDSGVAERPYGFLRRQSAASPTELTKRGARSSAPFTMTRGNMPCVGATARKNDSMHFYLAKRIGSFASHTASRPMVRSSASASITESSR